MNDLKNIKYAFFDLDGTTLNSKNQISPQTYEVFEILKRNNIKFGFATGRGTFLSLWIVDAVKADLPFVGMNGLNAYDFTSKKTLYKKSLDLTIANQLMNFLHDINLTFFVYDKDKILYYKYQDKSEDWFKWRESQNFAQEPKHRFAVKEITKQDFSKINPVFKIIIFTGDLSPEETANVKNKVDEFPGVYWLFSHDSLLEIMPTGESKGTCLQELEKQGIINLEQTIVFGDSNNDLEMLEVAKYGVAMANGTKEVKARATHQTLSNDDEGLYHFVTQVWKLK